MDLNSCLLGLEEFGLWERQVDGTFVITSSGHCMINPEAWPLPPGPTGKEKKRTRSIDDGEIEAADGYLHRLVELGFLTEEKGSGGIFYVTDLGSTRIRNFPGALNPGELGYSATLPVGARSFH